MYSIHRLSKLGVLAFILLIFPRTALADPFASAVEYKTDLGSGTQRVECYAFDGIIQGGVNSLENAGDDHTDIIQFQQNKHLVEKMEQEGRLIVGADKGTANPDIGFSESLHWLNSYLHIPDVGVRGGGTRTGWGYMVGDDGRFYATATRGVSVDMLNIGNYSPQLTLDQYPTDHKTSDGINITSTTIVMLRVLRYMNTNTGTSGTYFSVSTGMQWRKANSTRSSQAVVGAGLGRRFDVDWELFNRPIYSFLEVGFQSPFNVLERQIFALTIGIGIKPRSASH